MTLETIIMHFGYYAIGAGTLIEGETVLLLGGFFSHRGYLHLPQVMLVGFLGSFCGDQILFYLGRTQKQKIFRCFPKWRKPLHFARRLIRKYQNWIIILMRFMYGMRVVTPLALGMSRIKPIKFFLLNLLSSLIWSVLIALGGYYFGRLLEVLLGDLKVVEHWILAGLLVLGAGIGLAHWVYKRRTATRE